ncbi:hypothetical protein FLAG1_10613 [Fusarium langsethiae]|uniref:Uncharacterized protein n=1 Tax=Fusarium langsethiae TaxID=179993 RepID=A0A0M9END5_FUSLA|nr:hypothetical protein FLAG1_10613 [Fusarium langsethiae]
MERKGDNILYHYSKTQECEAFSNEILAIKAQDVFRILSLEGLERGSKVISVPTIYGFGTCGPRVVEGYAALAVLISASVEIEIHSNSGNISHHWQSGKILFLKPGTYISFNYEGELQGASMDIKEHENDDQGASVGIKEHENDGMEVRSQMESDEKRPIVYYTMFQVRRN